jgi:hypothetical protein
VAELDNTVPSSDFIERLLQIHQSISPN